MKFWKVSHGKGSLNEEEFNWLLDNELLAVHKDTGRGQANLFSEKLNEGDIVCLSRSNEVFALVKVSATGVEPEKLVDTPLGNEWLLKPYSVLTFLPEERIYKGKQKGWTPNYNSTCAIVANSDLREFEELILKPFFDVELDEVGQGEMTAQKETEVKMSLNTILYGPPGTGKTFHTIQTSVMAAEPDFKAKSRADLKKKYDELIAEKRIRFVTFHQSYGYEEFVEGLRANSDQGQVSYDVEPGIFKQICEQASQGVEPDSDPLEQALEQFKAELEESAVLSLKTLRGNDFGVQYHGNTTFRVFPEATSHEDLGRGYPVSIDNIRKLYRGLSTKKIYNSSYVKSILNYVKKTYNVSDYEAPKQGQAKNFVLIIDEINRGNISKIFGELITLIEDTKRSGEGQDEAIEVLLPNSGDPFTVPNNLYLIGTMNTADRSLAMMDTALRRRFDFVEMMPKPELFNDITVNGIDLEELIRKMNQRIEVLYDREHTLGHAFFMPVKALVKDQDKAFNELKSVFKNKVIPLLEEYFFEDWNKIRLVLGDNQKAEDLQFVSEEKQSFDSLFGNDHGLNSYQQEEKSYKLLPFDNDVWDSPEAYIGIYRAKKED
ncbi:hypothetical protein N480_09765 [Pseudoalteromonas luteoviolacea S2607]|uniref:McrB family protein n=1 Tax=Pseudoalteromonas luteoviolacea TaxID=43657 RepID=UPI0007B06FC7|nr:AAA family ATPase [Pseudoalteromonas luteoviolacea]KZN29045.1 hypothetical protein N480_09765 [Pseudoalteromonas luteoviolacea S2607]